MKETSYQTVNVSISLPRVLRDAARQAAFDDSRSLSGLITRLLNQHLQEEGYLEERPALFHRQRKHCHYPRYFPMLGNCNRPTLAQLN